MLRACPEGEVMSGSRILGLLLLAPAFVFVVLFFLAPVVLTAVFALTNMSTATGITGGAYQVTQSAMRELGERHGEQALADALARVRYTVDRSGIDAASAEGASTALLSELDRRLAGQSFDSRRELERAIKTLDNRPRGTRALKSLSALFERSIVNTRFATDEEFFDAVAGLGIELNATQRAALLATTYTGWKWTGENFSRMFSLPDTRRTFLNTIIYVFATLIVFNTGFALVLAIVTHYMPDRPAGIFRAIWLLPRISPPVLYVLLWKWLAWDTGFLSRILVPLGFESRNWMLDNPTNAWVFIVLINGFVGASMGMLIFSAAIRSIPVSLFYASEVDGAGRWQQVRYVILPQLRWPILFITCYQSLSLLTSFEYILLATEGGPGGATKVWALAAYLTALNNYAGNLEYGYGAALALVLVVVGVILSLAYLRLFDFKSLVAPPPIEQ
ncbi:MAG: sugar ABC transporter permease [Boseongicola sp.]|nr:sugar ABC transporter permease [Boseongicola sp.]